MNPQSPNAPSPGQPTPTPLHHENRHTLRVRYCECDPMGVAHHASYVAWLEIGRTELLRTSGVSYAHLERAGVFLVIVKLEVKYRRPIRYDDLVEVRTRWSGGSRVKIEHAYELWVTHRGGHTPDAPAAEQAVESELAAIASTTLGCVDGQGKIQPLPEWLVFRPGA